MKQPPKRQEKFTEDEKLLIIKSYGSGIKATALSKQMNKSISSISTFMSRWKLNNILPPKEKVSKAKIAGRMVSVVKKVVGDNPKLGLTKLCAKVKEEAPNSSWHPKKTCLQSFLKKSGYKKRNPSLKPPLSEANREKRLLFAKKWMNDNICTLENVIWTDECRVASNPNNRRVSVWSNSETAPKQIKMHSGGNSVMFWGCFSKHGTGNLVSLKGTMDGKQYIEVLTENLLEEFKNGKKNIPGK